MDRDELIRLVERFQEALDANDPSRLPLGPNPRYTENCQNLPLGKGIWVTATPSASRRPYLIFAEPDAGQVGFFGVAHENHQPSILSVRMRLADSRIAEIEALVTRSPGETGYPRVFAPDNMLQPRAGFEDVIEPSERTPRDRMIEIVSLYFDGILAGDGSMIPVLDDCRRIENGVQTVLNPDRGTETGKLGVAAQVDTGIFRDIEAARERRFPIVDEERGLVFAMFFFDHPGTITGSGFQPRYSQPNSMMVTELFKIRQHKITQIEAVLNVFPYGITSGWPA